MKSLLVVCIGNICRSPMAEAVMQNLLPDIKISSAGVDALVGKPADQNAIDLMSLRGIDITSHIAKQINKQICIDADLILTMDEHQKTHIERLYPLVRGKVFSLLGPASKGGVPDPYKAGKRSFENALELIDRGAALWTGQIKAIRNNRID